MCDNQTLVESHLESLRDLPPEVRLELGERLIETVPGFRDPEVRNAWDEEIDRRLLEIEQGEIEPVPASEVFRKAWERLDEIRRQASAS